MSLPRTLALVEAALVGSTELDDAIATALGTASAPYSQSLDAAMMLVPKGWTIAQLAQRTDGRGRAVGWIADLYRPDLAVLPDAPARLMSTAALALTTASLRAYIDRSRPARAA
ncbi:hypothetical protein GCM10011611_18990 [Aliidongia dinghuensis]|uniref:Uncharacterized protein n=1 Tax=Aliidongia dinghuensis TaxID=1867774 RepID=A0A8J2YSD4_9PROT|nr:hypothetical protein [Aliidongia dinghuensis]GGF13487.1 hypothetical protein GCM10011611_18990 [Aliidongia dinghuensis]